MSKTKTLTNVVVKSAERGEVEAVFSTFNVVDKDGDVTLPGAITDGAEVVISAYGHGSWEGRLPVGKGRIRTTDTEAVLEGRFFLNTEAGRETFEVVKELGSLGEWSYSLRDVVAKRGELDGQAVNFLESIAVKEVSPVLVGAGVNTRTLATKAAALDRPVPRGVKFAGAIRPHDAATTRTAWKGADPATGVGGVDTLRAVHAWVDLGADPTDPTAYKFAHHAGPGEPANVRACLLGIARLNGAAGKAAGIPDADREGVYHHLAEHLRDADLDPPPLRKSADGELMFSEQATYVMASVSDLLERSQQVMSLRAAKGRGLSQHVTDLLKWIGDDLHQLRDLLDEPTDLAAREFARFVAASNSITD